ncbi:hypothetical protein ACFL0Z_01580 [Patescibacteria group bacterium]
MSFKRAFEKGINIKELAQVDEEPSIEAILKKALAEFPFAEAIDNTRNQLEEEKQSPYKIDKGVLGNALSLAGDIVFIAPQKAEKLRWTELLVGLNDELLERVNMISASDTPMSVCRGYHMCQSLKRVLPDAWKEISDDKKSEIKNWFVSPEADPRHLLLSIAQRKELFPDLPVPAEIIANLDKEELMKHFTEDLASHQWYTAFRDGANLKIVFPELASQISELVAAREKEIANYLAEKALQISIDDRGTLSYLRILLATKINYGPGGIELVVPIHGQKQPLPELPETKHF